MSDLAKLLDPKMLQLIRVLYQNKSNFYHLTQLAKEANVPAATTLRFVKTLTSSGLIKTHVVGKLKIYQYYYSESNENLMRLLL
ncbi:MAG: helix-turn-helix domain-containing protein [Candidatus Woesearchaeota archaeon]